MMILKLLKQDKEQVQFECEKICRAQLSRDLVNKD